LAGLLKPFSLPAKFHLGPQVDVAVLVTGLLATALAFTVMAWAQQYTSATRSALIFSLEPVVAWFTSWLLTGEVLSGRASGGAALILAGILLVELKPELKRTRPRRHPVRERVETEQRRPGSGDV
jgi:drug/metabolite transporter (DMT)-like permease